MGKPMKHHDQIAALAADIRTLRLQVLDRDRKAEELLHGEEEAEMARHRASATRMMLAAKLNRYFDESERERSGACPVHGDAVLVMCPDCIERNPQLRHHYDAFLAALRGEERAA